MNVGHATGDRSLLGGDRWLLMLDPLGVGFIQGQT